MGGEMEAKKILIVDDDQDLLDALRMRFGAVGYEVKTAENADQACQTVCSWCPDLVLLDIGMPGGDGHSVAQRVHGTPGSQDLPIIFLTARTARIDKEMAEKEGVDRYLTKPFDSRELMSAVEAVLAELPVCH
jgi:two-component system alkaline phosphatase synthesis response regulator PhoP